jgi:hypothetical protein
MSQAEQAVIRIKEHVTRTSTFTPASKQILSDIVAVPKLRSAADSLERLIYTELRGVIRDRTRNIRDTAHLRVTRPATLAPSTAVHDPLARQQPDCCVRNTTSRP